MKEYKGWKVLALNLLSYVFFFFLSVIVITPSEIDEFPGHYKFATFSRASTKIWEYGLEIRIVGVLYMQ